MTTRCISNSDCKYPQICDAFGPVSSCKYPCGSVCDILFLRSNVECITGTSCMHNKCTPIQTFHKTFVFFNVNETTCANLGKSIGDTCYTKWGCDASQLLICDKDPNTEPSVTSPGSCRGYFGI